MPAIPILQPLLYLTTPKRLLGHLRQSSVCVHCDSHLRRLWPLLQTYRVRSLALTGSKRKAVDISEAEKALLGKLARDTANRLRRNGWRQMVMDILGESNITVSVGSLPHRAAHLLQHLGRRGAGLPLRTEPWTWSQCDAAVQWGPHKSSHGEREFVAEELLDFCRQGYWIVVPYADAATLEGLRVSPLGVVLQRNRRPRLIVDYSFSGVNEDTLQWAPREAMQFGRALQRVFTTLVHAHPRYGPVQHLAKIDVADGFYRVWVQLQDVPKLGVVLPTASGAVPLIAFPLALPMGWVESPPYFTAITETACDRVNATLSRPSTGSSTGGRGSYIPSRDRTVFALQWPALPSTVYTQLYRAAPCLSRRRLHRRFSPHGTDAAPARTRAAGYVDSH